jgi:hypothetical protein
LTGFFLTLSKTCTLIRIGPLNQQSLEVTNEGSIFYTVLKNDIAIYLQHFLIDEFDGTDEAIVSVFRDDDENILNFGGTLVEAISHLNTILPLKSVLIPEFA